MGLRPFPIKIYWEDLDDKVSTTVLEFLNRGILPTYVNSAFIVLIPKIQNHYSIDDYRSISLCNVSYKIIAKTLAK